jgi:hypothetical protein
MPVESSQQHFCEQSLAAYGLSKRTREPGRAESHLEQDGQVAILPPGGQWSGKPVTSHHHTCLWGQELNNLALESQALSSQPAYSEVALLGFRVGMGSVSYGLDWDFCRHLGQASTGGRVHEP